MTINIELKVLIEVHDRFSISDHCNMMQLKNTRSLKMDPNRIGTNALKQYRMITSGITITTTAKEKCSTLPIDNILIYPRRAYIETFPNELYTLKQELEKKYNCIIDSRNLRPEKWENVHVITEIYLYLLQNTNFGFFPTFLCVDMTYVRFALINSKSLFWNIL